jgi:hypothetical protein
VLHSFTGGSDGAFPRAALLPGFAAADGAPALFGTSSGGYAYIASRGTVELESTSIVKLSLCGFATRKLGGLPCPSFSNNRQILR